MVKEIHKEIELITSYLNDEEKNKVRFRAGKKLKKEINGWKYQKFL